MKLDAKALRVTKPSEEELLRLVRRPIYLVLDNVLDTYNIGSIFRLADAIGAQEVLLCAGCETPPNTRIHKSAIGTEEWVRWRYFKETRDAIDALRSEVDGIKIVAVEQHETAISLGELNALEVFAVVVGHETDGVSAEVLNLCDMVVEIPMWGVNKSLNVHVSAAIVAYHIVAC